MSSVTGLAALEQRLHQDLDRLCLPAADWLHRPTDAPLDVAIVGAGMSGLAAAAALRFAGVHHVQLFDASVPGREGPWVTHGRMQTLRSPKALVGPALGQPSLTFRAWYEAQFGASAWDALDRIPREVWQEYLNWYRTVLDLPVSSQTRVEGITSEAVPGGAPWLRLETSTPGGTRETIRSRHVVLATGMDALGGPRIPEVADQIPRDRWQHNTEDIDFRPWVGRRLAVIGGGDSALDVAATALEAGVAEVQILIRAKDFSRVNYWKAFTHPGHALGFAGLTPEQKLPLLNFLKAQAVPPAQGTIRRLTRFENVHLHFNSPVTSLSVGSDRHIVVTTPHGQYPVDHLVFATGYTLDLGSRPELASFARHIRFWKDRDLASLRPDLQGLPDLEEDFAFKEKHPGVWPGLGQIHLFTGAALLSLGKLTGDIPGISAGAERLTRGIVARLYAADLDHQFQQIQAYTEFEVHGHEWSHVRVDH